APGPATAVLCVAQRLDRSAGGLYLLELLIGEEPQEPAVGGPEGIRGVLGPGERLGLEAVEGADPELLLAVRRAGRVGQRPAVGRERERGVLEVELRLGRQLEIDTQDLSRRRRVQEVSQPGPQHAEREEERR